MRSKCDQLIRSQGLESAETKESLASQDIIQQRTGCCRPVGLDRRGGCGGLRRAHGSLSPPLGPKYGFLLQVHCGLKHCKNLWPGQLSYFFNEGRKILGKEQEEGGGTAGGPGYEFVSALQGIRASENGPLPSANIYEALLHVLHWASPA